MPNDKPRSARDDAAVRQPHPENAHQADRTEPDAVFGAWTPLRVSDRGGGPRCGSAGGDAAALHKSVTQASGYYNKIDRKMGSAAQLVV